MMRRNLLLLAASLLAGRASAQNVEPDGRPRKPGFGTVELTDVGAEIPSSNLVEKFGPEWIDLLPFLELCSVKAPGSNEVAIFVLATNIPLAYKERLFEKYPAIIIPDPIILDKAGTKIGVLPPGFPEDPPDRLRVIFGDWKDGFPNLITFYQDGEAALQPHRVPFAMVFDTSSRSFVKIRKVDGGPSPVGSPG